MLSRACGWNNNELLSLSQSKMPNRRLLTHKTCTYGSTRTHYYKVGILSYLPYYGPIHIFLYTIYFGGFPEAAQGKSCSFSCLREGHRDFINKT